MAGTNRIDAARRFLWEEDEPHDNPVVSTRLSGTQRVHDSHVDQSVNLRDIGDGAAAPAHGDPHRQGGVVDMVSGLFRSSASPAAPPPFDEYGDASPSTEAEEYLHHDKHRNRRLSPVVAMIVDSFGQFGCGKILCLIVSVGLVAFMFGGGMRLSSGKGGRENEIISRIVDAGLTDKNTLHDEGSPQNAALKWINHDDPASLSADHADLLERYVLAILYFSTNGYIEGWKRSDNWMTEKGICVWYGVKCVPIDVPGSAGEDSRLDVYDDNAAVLSIELVDNTIVGRIPTELSGLANLLTLDLSENELSGPLPTELGKMYAIRSMSFRKNNLEGSIPTELAQLSATVHNLNLGQNQLTGTIPSEIGMMEELRDFSVAENALNGPIPSELVDLTKLTAFYVDQNELTGSIPDFLDQWTSLVDLRLSVNKFIGTLTVEKFNRLSSLEKLLLDGNQFSGTIPDFFEHTSRLQEIQLHENNFSGRIPANLSHLTGLKKLSLNKNKLTGKFPPELGYLTDALYLNVAENELTGTIPSMLGWMDDIEVLYLHNNQLTGEIPTELGKCFRLVDLRLDSNALSGIIPTELGGLKKLQKFRLDNNNFDADSTMPQEVCDLKSNENLHYLSADCGVTCTCCNECM